MFSKVVSALKSYDFLILLICLLLGGILSVSLGQATDEFDTYNYYIYAPWAFLHNRYTIDILPCGIRSYFNPILDLPYYFLYKTFFFLPKVAGFIQGFWYGGVVFIGYKISTLLEFNNSAVKLFFRIFCTILTATSPVIMLLCGMAYVDLHVTIIILIAIYIYIKNCFNKEINDKAIILTGFLLGASFGLKLTSSVMVLGMFFASLLMLKDINKPLKTFILSLIGFTTGFFIINGYWYYKMWITFHNPFFPYFNNIFKSSFGSNTMIVDDSYTRVLVQGFIPKLIYPFTTFFSDKCMGFGSWLYHYRDIRIPLTVAAMIFLSIKNIFWKNYNNRKVLMFLIFFIVSTYILWINIFPIARYILPVFVVSNILLVYTLFQLLGTIKLYKNINMVLYIVIILFFFCVIFVNTKIDLKKYRIPFKNSLFSNINHVIKDNSTVILASQELSYVIPQIGPNNKFVYGVIPEHFNVKKLGYNTYKQTRTIDYYYSKYYENLLREVLNSKKSFYLLYLNDYLQEFGMYMNTLKYYINNFDIECSDINERINVCKIYKH